MSKQKIQYCQICQKEEAQHICPSAGCIKPQNNQLICFRCYVDQHAKNEISKHKPLTKNDLQGSAIEKSKEYIKFQEQCLKDNQELQQMYEQDLEHIFNKIFQWHGNQKKLLKEQIESANSILIDNIKQAQTVLQNPTIDLLLFFHLNINNTIQQNYERKKKLFNRNRKQEIMKLDYRTEQLTNNNLIFSKILNLEKTNYQLNSIISQVDIVVCQIHKKKNKYICIHPDCLSKDNQKLYCKKCMKQDHNCHEFKQFGKLVEEIQKDIEDKKKFIIDLNAQKQNEILLQVDKHFEYIWNAHKDIQEESNSILINLFLIEQHTQQKFNEIEEEAVSQDILLNGKLISRTKEQINQQFQATYQGFIEKMELDLKNSKKDLLSKCQLIDDIKLNLEQERSKLQTQISQLNRKILNQEDIIKDLSKENQFKQMKSSLDVIISNQNQQSKQSVQQLQFIQDLLKKLNDINYNNEFKQQKQLIENLINAQNQQSIQRHKEVQDFQSQLIQQTQTKSKGYLDQQKIILTEINQQAQQLENLNNITSKTESQQSIAVEQQNQEQKMHKQIQDQVQKQQQNQEYQNQDIQQSFQKRRYKITQNQNSSKQQNNEDQANIKVTQTNNSKYRVNQTNKSNNIYPDQTPPSIFREQSEKQLPFVHKYQQSESQLNQLNSSKIKTCEDESKSGLPVPRADPIYNSLYISSYYTNDQQVLKKPSTLTEYLSFSERNKSLHENIYKSQVINSTQKTPKNS